MSGLQLTVLGVGLGYSHVYDGQPTPAYVLAVDGRPALLIGCGGGAVRQTRAIFGVLPSCVFVHNNRSSQASELPVMLGYEAAQGRRQTVAAATAVCQRLVACRLAEVHDQMKASRTTMDSLCQFVPLEEAAPGVPLPDFPDIALAVRRAPQTEASYALLIMYKGQPLLALSGDAGFDRDFLQDLAYAPTIVLDGRVRGGPEHAAIDDVLDAVRADDSPRKTRMRRDAPRYFIGGHGGGNDLPDADEFPSNLELLKMRQVIDLVVEGRVVERVSSATGRPQHRQVAPTGASPYPEEPAMMVVPPAGSLPPAPLQQPRHHDAARMTTSRPHNQQQPSVTQSATSSSSTTAAEQLRQRSHEEHFSHNRPQAASGAAETRSVRNVSDPPRPTNIVLCASGSNNTSSRGPLSPASFAAQQWRAQSFDPDDEFGTPTDVNGEDGRAADERSSTLPRGDRPASAGWPSRAPSKLPTTARASTDGRRPSSSSSKVQQHQHERPRSTSARSSGPPQGIHEQLVKQQQQQQHSASSQLQNRKASPSSSSRGGSAAINASAVVPAAKKIWLYSNEDRLREPMPLMVHSFRHLKQLELKTSEALHLRPLEGLYHPDGTRVKSLEQLEHNAAVIATAVGGAPFHGLEITSIAERALERLSGGLASSPDREAFHSSTTEVGAALDLDVSRRKRTEEVTAASENRPSLPPRAGAVSGQATASRRALTLV